jgi:hypothetical protein
VKLLLTFPFIVLYKSLMIVDESFRFWPAVI